jgi:tetratricopeptide (TPR) repeat protein
VFPETRQGGRGGALGLGGLLAGVFALALLARLVYGFEIRDLPTQHELVMDAQRYDALARDVLDHGWRPHEPFYQAPLYPYLLAAVYAVAGRSLAAVRVAQAVLGALTAVLAAVAAARLFGERGQAPGNQGPEDGRLENRGPDRRLAAAAIAGVLAALYAPAVFYTPLLLKTVPALFLESAALVLLLPPGGRGVAALSARRGLAAGGALGGAALLQENLLLLVPTTALFVLFAARRESESADRARLHAPGIVPAFALAAGAALALTPAALLNHAAGGGLLLTSSQGGMNFYIGNARGATGTYVPLSSGSQVPERQRADAQRLAETFAAREGGRPAPLAPAAVSRVLWRETWRHIAADPASWLQLMLRKLRLFWNAYELPDAEGFRVYRRESILLRFDPVVFGLVAPLAALGLLAALRRPGPRAPAVPATPARPATPATQASAGSAARPATPRRDGALLLALLAAATCASVVLFFVFGRYRLAVVPFLLPLAAAGVLELAGLLGIGETAESGEIDKIAGRARPAAGWRGVARPALDLALLAGVGLAVNLPCFNAAEVRRQDAVIDYNLGTAAARWSDSTFADFQRLATAGSAAARQRLVQAVLLASQAASYFDEAARASPGFFAADLEWAGALERRGSCFAAAGAFARAATDFSAARRRLTGALADSREGVDPDRGAVDPELDREARRLLGTLDAATATALSNQAVQLIAAGRLDQAGAALSRAVALGPDLPAPRGSLGLCWYELGQAARRRGALPEARRLFEQSRDAYRRAVVLAGAAGRPDLAALYGRGLELAKAASKAGDPLGR